jgi:hypothetical protein
MVTTGIIIFSIAGCDLLQPGSDNGSNINSTEWLIPENEVVDGGPGQDGIPSIDNPQYFAVEDADFVDENRLVLGIKVGNVVRAYPHQVLDWHEIVNTEAEDLHYSLTYCPLTGTGIAFDREINNTVNEFGVSGLLFRNNLIMYDRETGSRWSQMQMRSVNGELSGKRGQVVHTIQTNWSTWKELYPESEVLSTETGFNRNYSGFAYGASYLTNNNFFIFEPKRDDDRLPQKANVHAILPRELNGLETVARIYSIEQMSDSIEVIQESFDERDLVIAGSSALNFMVSYSSQLDDGTKLTFEAVSGNLPVIMEDNEGNQWSIFGEAISGPRQGEQLTETPSFNGYWFAFADFYPNSCIYPNSDC